MNILITGSDGFIGKAVTNKLDLNGIKWTPFSGDILHPDNFLEYENCNAVLHLASLTRTDESFESQAELLDVNIQGTLNVIKFAHKIKGRLYFASTCSYGNLDVMPISEKMVITYHNPYSYSKWEAEHSISAWNKFFNLEGIIFRIFNVYGPNQLEGFLISDIINQVHNEKIVLSNLTAIRDYIFVDDLAELIVKAMNSKIDGLVTVNAGSGTGHSVKDVIDIIFKHLNRTLPIEDKNLPAFIEKSISDNKLARELFGWHPKTTLDEGIRQVLEAAGLITKSNLKKMKL